MATSEEYKKDLKIQALLEKVSSIVTNYEDQVANLRVELTVRNQEHERVVADLHSEIERLKAPKYNNVQVVDGEVIEETEEA